MITKPLICITTGEPAGIGPEICLDLVNSPFCTTHNLLLIGDITLLKSRAKLLNKSLQLRAVSLDEISQQQFKPEGNQLLVLDIKCPQIECIGTPTMQNSGYVLATLDAAVDLCQRGLSRAIVTAPINKDILNHDYPSFTGHTEYFASKFGITDVVMMLSNDKLNVALVTTHLPLKEVAENITSDKLNTTLEIITLAFQKQFGIKRPKIAVCGLNPHAGENGYLGREELEIINPVIKKWQDKGHEVYGSFPADTIFNHANQYDVILAMYHDQGLPVLKYSGFETGINTTLGLPIIRTSVDHGTAVSIAGTGLANSQSLHHALAFAIKHL